MNSRKLIGIIGGVGPLAGLDLAAKIVANSKAVRDQEHLPFILASLPELIPDRTSYLLEMANNEGASGERLPWGPAEGLIEVLKKLAQSGARLIAVPCNTAHAEPIFAPLRAEAERLGLELVNMLEETAAYLAHLGPGKKVAVLSTLGTYQSGVYDDYLDRAGIERFDPGLEVLNKVHEAIYHPEFGIKSRPDRDFSRAREQLAGVLEVCRQGGANLAVLGCTELPLVFEGEEAAGLRLVDPTNILARALIHRASPGRLAERSGVRTDQRRPPGGSEAPEGAA